MSISLADALAECRRIRMDLTNAQAKLTDVIAALSGHPDAEKPRPRCEECGLTFRGDLALAEHVYNHHRGPLPEHYAAAERAAGLEPVA